jgi:hypothetical protein
MAMKKTRLVIAIILVCLFATQIFVYAAPDSSTSTTQNEKKKVALIVVNNENATGVKQSKIEELWINPICNNLSERYNVSGDQKYYEKFKSAGYFTIIDAEKSDIIDVLQNDNLDYVILVEFLLADKGDSYADDTYHIQMRILDIKANKNIYNGKFVRYKNLSNLAGQMIAVINEKFM